MAVGMSQEPVLLSIRCDAMDSADEAITGLQQQNAELTVDDCLDVIFAVGLMAVLTTNSLVKPQ